MEQLNKHYLPPLVYRSAHRIEERFGDVDVKRAHYVHRKMSAPLHLTMIFNMRTKSGKEERTSMWTGHGSMIGSQAA